MEKDSGKNESTCKDWGKHKVKTGLFMEMSSTEISAGNALTRGRKVKRLYGTIGALERPLQ